MVIWLAALEVALQGALPTHILYVPGASAGGIVTAIELLSNLDGVSR